MQCVYQIYLHPSSAISWSIEIRKIQSLHSFGYPIQTPSNAKCNVPNAYPVLILKYQKASHAGE
jgi:hypothetical protein